MNLGTIQTADGFAYDETKNPLLAQNIISVTTLANGRSYSNWISNAEYATLETAAAFSRVLHGTVEEAREATTARTSYPKYEVLIGEDQRVNAGAIASVLGNDPGYGFNDGAKAGPIAELLGEKYDATVHIPLVRSLKKAVGA